MEFTKAFISTKTTSGYRMVVASREDGAMATVLIRHLGQSDATQEAYARWAISALENATPGVISQEGDVSLFRCKMSIEEYATSVILNGEPTTMQDNWPTFQLQLDAA